MRNSPVLPTSTPARTERDRSAPGSEGSAASCQAQAGPQANGTVFSFAYGSDSGSAIGRTTTSLQSPSAFGSISSNNRGGPVPSNGPTQSQTRSGADAATSKVAALDGNKPRSARLLPSRICCRVPSLCSTNSEGPTLRRVLTLTKNRSPFG